MSLFINVDADLLIAYGVQFATAAQLETARIAFAGVAPARDATRRPRRPPEPDVAATVAATREAYRSRQRIDPYEEQH